MTSMNRIGIAALLAVAAAAIPCSASEPASPAVPEIPYTRYVLDNGLTLLVHQDTKAPIVAVNVWYHVGSKNENRGKTGFAHLFEHLMFNGSEHFNDDYFQVLDRIGATDRNGTTNQDRTNYFQNVPVSALDTILWMESDRMGHLLGAVDQAKLDEQRGVVQNEKRQGENQPYGRVFGTILENTYPAGHPYSWSTIGSMEDLDAASLEDVHEWFKSYYGAANAVVVLAGDIDPETALEKVEHYFGDIPPGPPVARQEVWIARRTESHRHRMWDRVPQARIYKVWNVPEWGSTAGTHLDLLADILASGKSSRLYKRLVYEDQIATNVSAFAWLREIGGQVIVQATAKPGGDLAEVERALNEEMARLLEEGPTREELDRVRSNQVAQFIRGIERIGGFGGKSDVLAQGEVFQDNPEQYKVIFADIAAATPAALRDTAREWLSRGDFTLEVLPYPDYRPAAEGADRSKLPEPGPPPKPDFPDLQRARLDNGLEIVLAERHTVPLVELRLVMDAGYASDRFGVAGLASMVMDMLDEGTASRSALEISETLQRLGASLGASADLDTSTVSLSALKQNLGPSLELFADVVLHPSFPQDELERIRKQRLARIRQEKAQPTGLAFRVMPGLLYGPDHPYGTPFTGSGDEASVRSIRREDLVRHASTWFGPNNATLVVAGDITLAELRRTAEKLFGDWKPVKPPKKDLTAPKGSAGKRLYLLDRPGALQSLILAGNLAPPKSNPDEIAIELLNRILGGGFTSRINMNLREDKHWSYGSRTILPDARGPRPFVVMAPVQTDKTRESILEIRKELDGILGARPITADELEKARRSLTLTLPGSWETLRSVAGSAVEVVTFGLGDDYWDRYGDQVASVSAEAVAAAAPKIVRPDAMVWVVVGDRAAIEAGLRDLGFDEVILLDADGRPVKEAAAAAAGGPAPGETAATAPPARGTSP